MNANSCWTLVTMVKKTDTIKLHVRMVEQKMNCKFVYNDINNMKESTSMLKAVWKNQVKEVVGKMKYT
jgi:hypothetical protein